MPIIDSNDADLDLFDLLLDDDVMAPQPHQAGIPRIGLPINYADFSAWQREAFNPA
jgi:hypothetical protein